MNKKRLLQNFIYVVFGIIFAIGLSYVVHASGTYTDGSNPPANNTPTPLNVGTTDQIKSGGLAVNGFIANANAGLGGSTYFGGVLHADPANSNATINFGGTDTNSIVRDVAMAISGGFSNTGSITSTVLSNQNMTPVCADSNGDVVLCTTTAICTNIPGSTTIPTGEVRNSDGTCSVPTKRFYSVLTVNKVVQDVFVGGIVNGLPTYHAQTSGTPYPPLVDSIGLDNDAFTGWQIDDISGMQGTGLSDSGTRLMDVAENGSYDFTFNLQGQIGIKGKFASDGNEIGVDFYLKVNNQYIPMDSSSSPVKQEPYPVSSKNNTDFGNIFTSTVGFGGIGGNGNVYYYVPYSVNFNKTLTLNSGDTVDVYALVYGQSNRDGLFQANMEGDYNNFYYSMQLNQGSSYNIIETPQG